MAKRITKDEVSEQDIFGWIGDSAEKNLESVEALNDAITEFAKTQKKIASSKDLSNQKQVNQIVAGAQKIDKVTKKAIETDKQRVQLNNQMVKSNQALLVEQQKQRLAKQQATAQAKQIARLQLAEKGSIEAVRAELALVTRAWTKLTKEEIENTKRGKRLNESKRKLTEELKRLEAATGDNRRNVGNYTSAVDKLGASFKNVGAMAAKFGLAVGGIAVLRSSINTVKEFETQVADLSAITGATGNDLDFLKGKALDFSKEFGQSGAEIVEAFKLAGSARPELLANGEALAELTEKAIVLSKASGDDVPTSINNLAGTLNAFNKDASAATEIMDILANASQKGSKEIPFVTQAFEKFGGVAAANNVSVAESASVIEFLGKKISDAGGAGTNFRNILLKMSAPDTLPKEALKSMNRLGIDLDVVSDKSLSFSERLEALTPLLKDSGALTRVFGSQNVLAAQTMLENAKAIGEFTGELGEAGTAQDQMNTKSKTLGEAMNKLTAIWEAFIIKISESTGAGEGLTGIVDGIARAINFLIDNIDTVILVLKQAIKTFIIYKTLTSDLTKRVAKFAKAMGDSIGNIKGMGDAFKKASTGAKAMGKALKSIGFAIAIELAIELVIALRDIASGARAAREAYEAYQAALERGANATQRFINANRKLIDQEKQRLKLDVAKGLKTEAEAREELTQIIERQSGKFDEQIKIQQEGFKQDKKTIDAIKLAREEYKKQFEGLTLTTEMQNIYNLVLQEYDNQIRTATFAADEHLKIIGDLEAEVGALKTETVDLTIEQYESAKAQGEAAGNAKKLNTEFESQIDLLDELNGLFEASLDVQSALNDIEREQQINELNRLIDAEKEYQLALIENESYFDPTRLNELMAKRKEIQLQAVEEIRVAEIDAAKRAFNDKFIVMQENLDAERDKLLEQTGLTNTQRESIEANYQAELKKLKALEVAEEQALQEQIVLINAEANAELLTIKQGTADSIKNADDELTQALIDNNKEVTDSTDDAIQRQKDLAALMNEVGEQILNGFIDRSKKKQEIIDDEIAKSKELEDALRQSAQNGNAIASESLAAQEEFTNERIRAKQAEEQKQRLLEEAQIVRQMVLQFIENGDNPIVATTKALSTSQIIRRAIAGISGFFTGTKTTVADELGAPLVSGKDGYVIRVDGKEKILNPALSAATGNATTNEIVEGFLYSQALNNGMIVPDYNISTTSTTFDFAPLQKDIQDLNRTVQKKKEIILHPDVENGILMGMMKIEKEGLLTRKTRLRP